MQTFVLTDSWVKITPEGSGVCVIQGTAGEVYLGTVAPTAAQPGIRLVENWPIPVDTSKFTQIWVRGYGVARFAG